MEEKLLDKLGAVQDQLNSFGGSYTYESLQRAQKELVRYQEEINALQAEVSDCQKRKKMDTRQAETMEKNLELLLFFNKRLSQLLSSYGNIAELQNVISAVEVETVMKACRTVEDLKKKAMTDGEPEGAVGGPTGERELERLLDRDVNGVHGVWSNVKSINNCLSVHIDHASRYTEYYVRGYNYERTMPRVVRGHRRHLWQGKDIRPEFKGNYENEFPSSTQAEKDFGEGSTVKPSEQESRELLLNTMEDMMAMLAYWWQRIETLVNDSRKIVPVSLRQKPLEYKLPACLIHEFADPDSGVIVPRNEQVFVLNRVSRTVWHVETVRKQSFFIPAIYIELRVPDLEAINLALVLRKHLLQQWTLCVRDCGLHCIEQLFQIYLEVRQMADFLADYAVGTQPELRQWCQNLLEQVVEMRKNAYDSTGNRVDAETLLNMRRSINADSGFFEFEAHSDDSSNVSGSGAGSLLNASGTLKSLTSAVAPGTMQIPIQNERYTRRLENKLYSWLTVCEASRGERERDLETAIAMMDSVDYANLVITIQMITHLLEAMPLVFEYNLLLNVGDPSRVIEQAIVDRVAQIDSIVRSVIMKYQDMYRMWDLCRGLLERQQRLDLVNESLLADLRAVSSQQPSTSVLDVDEILADILAGESPETIQLQLNYLLEYARAQVRTGERARPDLDRLFVTAIEQERERRAVREPGGARLYVDVASGDILSRQREGGVGVGVRRGDNVNALLINAQPLRGEFALQVDSFEPPESTREKTEYTLLINAEKLPAYKPTKTAIPTVGTYRQFLGEDKPSKVEFLPGSLAVQLPLGASFEPRESSEVGILTDLPMLNVAGLSVPIQTQTMAMEEPATETESMAPCSATQTDAPFVRAPTKHNLRITHVWDTKDEKFYTKKQALKLKILNKETKQYWSRATDQRVWIGDAIVKGYIRIAPKVFVQHPKINIQIKKEEEEGEAQDAAAAQGGDKQGAPKFRVVANV